MGEQLRTWEGELEASLLRLAFVDDTVRGRAKLRREEADHVSSLQQTRVVGLSFDRPFSNSKMLSYTVINISQLKYFQALTPEPLPSTLVIVCVLHAIVTR